MFIVKLTGGLGNQMFQYALYSSLNNLRKNVFVDNASFQKRHKHEEIGLEDVFPGLSFEKVNNDDVLRLADLKKDYFNKIRRKVLGKRKTHIQETDILYKKEILELEGDYYLDGYWQSEKYFKPIEDEIRSAFSFRRPDDQRNYDLMRKMKNENSVSIHIRKGNDFQSKSRKNICDAEYYRQAVENIKLSVEDPVFYVFSDNFTWAKENLDFIDATFIDWNSPSGANSYLDMQIMSCSRNNIIANSTYSWWSAWLNDNADKKVIAPNVWFNDNTVKYNVADILPGSWITI